jgi:hypothetical protein
MFDPQCLTFLFVQLHFLLVLVEYTGQPEILCDVIVFDMQVYQILVPVGFSGIQSTPGMLPDVLTCVHERMLCMKATLEESSMPQNKQGGKYPGTQSHLLIAAIQCSSIKTTEELGMKDLSNSTKCNAMDPNCSQLHR